MLVHVFMRMRVLLSVPMRVRVRMHRAVRMAMGV
jgi:hypothetical protein